MKTLRNLQGFLELSGNKTFDNLSVILIEEAEEEAKVATTCSFSRITSFALHLNERETESIINWYANILQTPDFLLGLNQSV